MSSATPVPADFPTTSGAFDTTGEGSGFADGFVTKLNPSGSALAYSTFLAGESDEADVAFGIDVDADGNAHVTGATRSPDFPTTAGAYDRTLGGLDAFVTKLNAAGSHLVFSTLLGGSGPENGTTIAIQEGGDVFVSGGTSSGDFPATAGAFDESHNGSDDAMLARLGASGSSLVYATYFGGSGQDYGLWGLAVDSSGNALFSGYTDSSDLPTSPNALANTFGGGQQDGWVAKIATGATNPDSDGDGIPDDGGHRADSSPDRRPHRGGSELPGRRQARGLAREGRQRNRQARSGQPPGRARRPRGRGRRHPGRGHRPHPRRDRRHGADA